jgi:hypothetical protein
MMRTEPGKAPRAANENQNIAHGAHKGPAQQKTQGSCNNRMAYANTRTTAT